MKVLQSLSQRIGRLTHKSSVEVGGVHYCPNVEHCEIPRILDNHCETASSFGFCQGINAGRAKDVTHRVSGEGRNND
jgi:hypothetical protein